MRQPESLASASVTSSSPERAGVASAGLPSVPGILTADQVLATGKSIAAMQQREGAIGWPDGHVDAWNHVECLMARQRVRTPRRGAARLRVAAGDPATGWVVAEVCRGRLSPR